jgi:PIN domain nuclease of toxin-antitoxin system
VILLDTCAAIWVSAGMRVSAAAAAALDEAYAGNRKAFVSAITAWEAGMLLSRGRAGAPVDPRTWFASLLSLPGFAMAGLSPDILIAASFLPGAPPRDPADRIIIATARAENLVVLTRDRPMLDYAAAGHVRAIAC